jgi:putative sigma-54 modulation protein
LFFELLREKKEKIMKFEYTGRHIEVTPTIRSHVEEHFERINHLFDGNNRNVHIIIEVEKGKHRSEIIVKWHDQVLTATTVNSDMYKSLSETIDKIEKQALRLKNKIIDKHHKAQKVSTIKMPTAEIQPAPSTPKIVNTSNYPVKPMTEEEAVLRLDEEENQFLVFRNAENERFSVIYKRKDGNYGLIQP